MITKKDLIDEIAQELECTKADADRFLAAFQDSVIKHVAVGEEVKLAGFLTISTVERAARTMKSPRTGEPIQVAASTAVKLRPMKALKDAAAKK